MSRCLTVITAHDVGSIFISVAGVKYFIGGVLGHIQSIDVGKRVFIDGTVLTVENQEQMERRLAHAH